MGARTKKVGVGGREEGRKEGRKEERKEGRKKGRKKERKRSATGVDINKREKRLSLCASWKNFEQGRWVYLLLLLSQV